MIPASGAVPALAAQENRIAAGLDRLARIPYDDLEFARVDVHRELRQGAPEAVLAEGKTPAQWYRQLGMDEMADYMSERFGAD